MQRFLLNFVAAFLSCVVAPSELNAEDAFELTERGASWMSKGEYDKAIDAFAEAIQRRIDAKDTALCLSSAYSNRSVAWNLKGEYEKAITDCDKALALNPDYGPAYFNRGEAWYGKGEYDKAIADYSMASTAADFDERAYCGRANAWNKKGEYRKAIVDYTEDLSDDPKDTYAYSCLALLYATCPDEKYRDAKKAVENAKKACELGGTKYWYGFGVLAAAYAESGDFDKAREWQEKAIVLANADKRATDKLKSDARSRLVLYKQGKPYREELKK